jgi:hypothetical protein
VEIERAVGAALPTLASMLRMPIPQGISRMLLTAISPLGEGGHGAGSRGFGRAVFPASAAAVAGLEKRKFVAGGRDDGRSGASGCSICLEELEDGEEVSRERDAVLARARVPPKLHRQVVGDEECVPSLPPWTAHCHWCVGDGQ